MSDLALPASATRRSHPPLLHIGAALGGDLVSTLFYAGVFALTHDLRVSWALALAAGVGGLVWTRWRGRPLGALQLVSFGLVVVLGAAALVTQDPRLVMLKPTLIYAAIAAAMMKRGWMRRYVPTPAIRHAPDVVDAFGYVWAAAMALNGGLNLALAINGDLRLWAATLAVAPLALKLSLAAVQYVAIRTVVVRRIARAPGAASFIQG